jgi:CHAD domain-containing protein
MREVELKLSAPESFVMPPLFHEGVGVEEVEELPQLEMRTVYYDTADLRLARSGVTLRYRRGEEGGPRWTVKLPVVGEKLTAREEQHFSGKGGQIPRAAKDLVTAYARSASLAAVSSVATRRYRWLLKGDGEKRLAEVVDDEVSVLEDGHIAGRFRELEIEAIEIDPQGLEPIAQLLTEAGASAAEPIPKSVRALGVQATRPPDVPVDLHIRPTDPAGRAAQAALAAGVRRLVAHDAGVRLGEDPEAVHQMRVGSRRLRSDLLTFTPFVAEAWVDAIRFDLKWLGEKLGDVRDIDVQMEDFGHRAADLRSQLAPLFDELETRHGSARETLVRALRSTRYRDLLDRLVEAVTAPPFTQASQRPCSEALPELVAKEWMKLAKAVRELEEDASDEAYHGVRIRAKRTRYAAEAVAPALGSATGRDAKRFAKRAADVQDVLGEMQDAVVAVDLIEGFGTEHARSGQLNFTLGRLLERQAARRDLARSRFVEVWKTVDRKRNLQWLAT